ncbi:MAG: WhiB family transcriptional regulator [Acidimicrobiales bacterium]
MAHELATVLLYSNEPTPDIEQLAVRPAWTFRAACRGMGTTMFFPALGDSLQPARAICAECPVREPCLDYALGSVEGGALPGVWGGTSARERRGLKSASGYKATEPTLTGHDT